MILATLLHFIVLFSSVALSLTMTGKSWPVHLGYLGGVIVTLMQIALMG